MIGHRAWLAVLGTSLIIGAIALWATPDEPVAALIVGGLPVPGLAGGIWARQQGLRVIYALLIAIAGLTVAWFALDWAFSHARLLPFGKVTPEQKWAAWVFWPALTLGLSTLGFVTAYVGTAIARLAARKPPAPK